MSDEHSERLDSAEREASAQLAIIRVLKPLSRERGAVVMALACIELGQYAEASKFLIAANDARVTEQLNRIHSAAGKP